MDKTWQYRTSDMLRVLYVLILVTTLKACESEIDKELKKYVDSVLSVDKYSILPGIGIERVANSTQNATCVSSRSLGGIEDYIKKRIDDYTKTHVLSVDIPTTARFFQGNLTRKL